jgi:mannose-6-phosphate isomerase-like protein (cupin superfamily)
MNFFNDNCANLARNNADYRRVLFTAPHTQLVLMAIPAGDEIPQEVHRKADQIIIIVEGQGEAILDGNPSPFKKDSVVIVPSGTKHCIKNTGSQPLKLYTIYSPPQHAPGTIEKTKEEAGKE